MLYKSTVKPELLELLTLIMNVDIFNDFKLAGGTSLSLQIGHRISIDLDFFSTTKFNQESIISYFEDNFSNFTIFKNTENIIQLQVNNIKLDFLYIKYPEIYNSTEIERIRLYSLQDIGAMKLNAIANRGTKKDFYDVHFLLKYYTINELIGFYKDKFKQNELFSLYKSITYFEDCENEPNPIMIKKTSWKEVKKVISENALNLY